MIGYVYLITNEVNNICYIGKRQKPYFDKAYKGSGTRLKLALAKYGQEKFHTYILEWCESVKGLCDAEIKWIAKFKSFGVELYNIARGGDGGNMVDWKSMPAERRAEINKKNSESHRGEKNGFYGRHHSEVTKELLRTANKNKRAPQGLLEYIKQKRDALPKVEQVDIYTGEVVKVWNSWCEAGIEITGSRCGYSHISECCKGLRRSAYGYKWRIAEGGWRL